MAHDPTNHGQKKAILPIFCLFLVPDFLQSCRFDCQFSHGDFVGVSQESSKKSGLDETLKEQVKDDVTKTMPLFFSPVQMKVVLRCTKGTQVLRSICPMANAE